MEQFKKSMPHGMILKNDRFRRARGGYSRLLEISCVECKEKLFEYQKDGPGILKRLYIDRIVGLETAGKNLTCPKCGILLGVHMVYPKEKRLAYRLFVGAVEKQIKKK